MSLAIIRRQTVGVAAVFGGFALLLMVEGLYVLQTRSRGALLVEAVTLGTLAALNLFSFAWAIHEVSHAGAVHGRPANPLVGLLMAWTAWKSWKARTVFTDLQAKTNPADEQLLNGLIDETLAANPQETPSVVALKVKGFTLSDSSEWRIRYADGMVLVVNFKSFFGKKRPIAIEVVLPASLRFELEGETWIGGKRVVSAIIDGQAGKKFEVTSEMFERLQQHGSATLAATAI